MQQFIHSKRQNDVLIYALHQIEQSPAFPYISRVFLYGSCARGQEKYTSDVDLLLEMQENCPESTIKDIRRLRYDAMTPDILDPETDIRMVIGREWERSNMPFYKNVRKDGIRIWPSDGEKSSNKITA